jgi:uncharacterized protein with HEPN domain
MPAAFTNRRIDAGGVWRVIRNDVPQLRSQVAALFEEPRDPG